MEIWEAQTTADFRVTRIHGVVDQFLNLERLQKMMTKKKDFVERTLVERMGFKAHEFDSLEETLEEMEASLLK